MATLTPDDLFERWFWPHYPPDVRADPARYRHLDANPGKNPALAATLSDAAALFVANAPKLLGIAPTWDAAGVGTLARALDRATRDRLLAESDPGDPGNPFFNTVVHAALFVGEVAVRAHGGTWALRRPLWESLVTRRTGGAVAPFHWILKALGDDEVDAASLAYRFHVHVELASADVDALPVIEAPRKLPTIRSPTYDLLVKYLRQHLPNLKDVGEGFPTPAELAARRFGTLAFELLHGGRVLALHGQSPPRDDDGPSTVEVLWLTAHGYDHADVVPSDRDVPYFGRAVTDEMLEVTVGWKGRPHTHRLTFRGHA